MNSKPDLNHKPEEFDLARDSEVIDKLFSNFDSIALENACAEQNFPNLVCPSVKSGLILKKAVYITEIEDRFYLLDYTADEFEPQPVLLTANKLVESSQPSLTKELSLDHTSNSKSASFLGKQGLSIGIGLGILLTLGATRIFSPQTAANPRESELTTVNNTAPAQTVTVTEVTNTDINSTLNVSGTVTAYEKTPVMSQAAGLQITDIVVERGDYVNQGQMLAKLSNRVLSAEKIQAEGAVNQAQARLDELQAGSRIEEIAQAEARVANTHSAIAQAESDLKLVQKRVERNQTLQAQGAISRDRLDEVLNQEQVAKSDLAGAKANLNEAEQVLVQAKAGSRPQTIAQAQAELAQAQGQLQAIEAQLADTSITAPRAGIIASREAKVGQITSTSQMLFTIIQDGRLELKLQIPETLISRIQLGQKVQITSNSNSNLEIASKVREIDPLIDDSSRQATVKVDLPEGTNLKPGMFLQAAVNTDTSKGQAVPIKALLPQSGNTAIAFIVQSDNTVKAQTVKMGEILLGQKVEVVEGLQPGDRLVVKGAAYLKDGDRVAISKEQVSSTK
ncbi:MAG TPA: efflux RND transporter periplasmic adaptor subunit [Coleofasciculaceae cyanobacterium]